VGNVFHTIGIVGAAPLLKIRKGGYQSYAFATFALPLFTTLFQHREVDGKIVQVIPSNIGELFTARALAYWLSGDSSFNKRDCCIQITTDSFTLSEVDLLRSLLLDQLNIESTRNANGKGQDQYIIRIPKREVPKVQELVEPFMPHSMRYRVGL
jgi:hypothetical protein